MKRLDFFLQSPSKLCYRKWFQEIKRLQCRVNGNFLGSETTFSRKSHQDS